MTTLRRLFGRGTRAQSGAMRGSRFDRYYTGVLRQGSGYPTADEARRDLQRRDESTLPLGWPR